MGDLYFGDFAPDWPAESDQEDAIGIEQPTWRPESHPIDLNFDECIDFIPEIPHFPGLDDHRTMETPIVPQDPGVALTVQPPSGEAQTPSTGPQNVVEPIDRTTPRRERPVPSTPAKAAPSYPTPAATQYRQHNSAQAPPVDVSPSQRAKKPQRRRNDTPCTWEGCTRLLSGDHHLKQHIREKHTGERPYACGECASAGKVSAFARPATLYRHLRDIHGINAGPGRGQANRRGGSNLGAGGRVAANHAGGGGGPGSDVAAEAHMSQSIPRVTCGTLPVASRFAAGDAGTPAPFDGLMASPADEIDLNELFDFDLLLQDHDQIVMDPALRTGTPDDQPVSPESIDFGLEKLQTIPGGRYTCALCGYTRDNQEEIAQHMHIEHHDAADNSAVCSCMACSWLNQNDGSSEAVHEQLLDKARPEDGMSGLGNGNAEAEHERLLNMPRSEPTEVGGVYDDHVRGDARWQYH